MKALEPGRELAGMKAILAVPTYGPVDSECARDIRVAMMVASRHGLEWVGDASPERMNYGVARNHIAQSLYRGARNLADGIMWIDSDIRMAPNHVMSLIASARQFAADFVCGVYHQRGGVYGPALWLYNKKVKMWSQLGDYPLDSMLEIDGCGFGFVWTSQRLIQKIAKLPDFSRKHGWFPDRRDVGGFGEDLSFCYYAKQAGVRLYANTAILLGHTAERQVIRREDWLKLKEGIGANIVDSRPVEWGEGADATL